MESSVDTLILSDIAPDSTVIVLVPYTNITTNRLLVCLDDSKETLCVLTPKQRVTLDAEYSVAADTSLSRSIHLLKTVTVDLPISVNVQDYFRGTRFVTLPSFSVF
jgi:hypothetical protein